MVPGASASRPPGAPPGCNRFRHTRQLEIVFPNMKNFYYLCAVIQQKRKTKNMTQLIVSLEDASMLSDIKKAIRMLRGVASVRVSETSDIPNSTTIRAMEELESGQTVVCEDFNAYMNLVSRDLPD